MRFFFSIILRCMCIWFNYRCPFCGFNNVKLFCRVTQSPPLKGERKNIFLYVHRRQIESEAEKKFNLMQSVCFYAIGKNLSAFPFYIERFCCAWAKKQQYMKVQKQHSQHHPQNAIWIIWCIFLPELVKPIANTERGRENPRVKQHHTVYWILITSYKDWYDSRCIISMLGNAMQCGESKSNEIKYIVI